MTINREIDPRYEELERLLDSHGADRTRWPASVRLRLSSLIATDPRAKAMLAEAAALESLLDLAPRVGEARERALASRILAAATAAPRPAAATVGQTAVAAPSLNPASPIVAFVARRRFAAGPASAALLAASLVLGVFIGTSAQISPAFDALAEAIGLSDDVPEVALLGDQQTSAEDIL